MTQVLVIAKEPVSGRVKTRLSPPFTPGQCARLAAAALADTMHAVAATLVRSRVLALDGVPGSWLPGLRRPDPALLLGVPMSQAHTGAAQLARLTSAGLSVAILPGLNDVDTAEDAFEVAAQAPGSRFAAALRAMRVTVQ